ncbi:hypothetical protein Dimus_034371 [Dionaea muscipula]
MDKVMNQLEKCNPERSSTRHTSDHHHHEWWVVEECPALLSLQETGVLREEHHIHGLSTGAEAAMAGAEEKRRTQGSVEMSPSTDGDRTSGSSEV